MDKNIHKKYPKNFFSYRTITVFVIVICIIIYIQTYMIEKYKYDFTHILQGESKKLKINAKEWIVASLKSASSNNQAFISLIADNGNFLVYLLKFFNLLK